MTSTKVMVSMNQANDQVVEEISQAINQNPQNSTIIARRGEIYKLRGDYQEALADFNRAIIIDPSYAWAIAHRGDTYRRIERYQEAIADFTQAIAINPNYIWAIAHRGVTYERIERYEESLVDLNQAIELSPNYAWAFAYRCRAYEMLRCYEEAIVNFDRAIALNQTIIKDWVTERGLLLSFLKQYPDAMEYYNRALQESPENHFTLYCIAFTKTRWQSLATAQPAINKARTVLQSQSSFIERSTFLYELGGLAALEGKTNQALDYLQEAIGLDYMPRRRALHDLAWLDFYSNPRFQGLVGQL